MWKIWGGRGIVKAKKCQWVGKKILKKKRLVKWEIVFKWQGERELEELVSGEICVVGKLLKRISTEFSLTKFVI